MSELSWTGPALAVLRRIDTWLEKEASPELAIRILGKIRERSKFLADFPRGGRPMMSKEYRVLRVHDTPYLLAYRITETKCEILRVFHEREDWHLEP